MPKPALLAAMTLTMCGCMDPDWAKKLDTGTLQPNMRFELAIDSDLDPQKLHPRLLSLANEEDYLEYVGQPIQKQFARWKESEPVWTFSWRDKSRTKPIDRIAFLFNASNRDDGITVILFNDGMQDFDLADWLVYKDWHTRVLPEAFPNARIRESETRHPAMFTSPDQIENFARHADMSIPEKYRRPKTRNSSD